MPNPIDPINQLVDAMNHGDLERAVAAYERDAVLVAQPGQIARGAGQLRDAIVAFIGLQPTLTSETEELVEAGDIALYVGRWNLRGTDPMGNPVTMAGESTDILRRQEDGTWLIALDNPWGTQILAPEVT